MRLICDHVSRFACDIASPMRMIVASVGIMDGSRKRTKVGVSWAHVARISLIDFAGSFSRVCSSGMQMVPPIISGVRTSMMEASKECAAN